MPGAGVTTVKDRAPALINAHVSNAKAIKLNGDDGWRVREGIAVDKKFGKEKRGKNQGQ